MATILGSAALLDGGHILDEAVSSLILMCLTFAASLDKVSYCTVGKLCGSVGDSRSVKVMCRTRCEPQV